MDYRVGRSAMVFYACTEPDETLRGFVAGRGARELDRLLKGFVERFGSLPISNASGGRRATPADGDQA